MPFDRPSPTLGDVIDRLQAKRLPTSRQRDLISAIRRVAEILGEKPSHLTADVSALRMRLAQINAAEVGVAPKTWANLRANFMAALDASGLASRLAAKAAPRTKSWDELLAPRTQQTRYGLSRLATWASQEGLEPPAVDDVAFLRFEEAMCTQTIARHPEATLRQMRQIWNTMAADSTLGLSILETRAAMRPTRIAWNSLPSSFRADVESHLAWAAGADMFAADARPRPLAPRSVVLRRNFIHSAAASLVEAGWSPDRILDLATLTSPMAFRAALGHRYKARSDKAANAYDASLGKALVAIAKEWVRPDSAVITELKKMLSRLPSERPGMTAKNKLLLRFFDDPEKLNALLRLPKKLWSTALKRDDATRRLAEAQSALAIAIVLFAPLRRANLAALTINQHVFLPKAPNGETLVELDAAMMKTREPFTLVLPPSVTRMLRAYEPILGEHVTGPARPIFINPDGSRKGDGAVGRLIENALRRELGVNMTTHQFRHLAAKIMLDADPGAYETLRQLLGHKNLKTTVNYYAELDTKRVSRIHAALIEQRLARSAATRRSGLHR